MADEKEFIIITKAKDLAFHTYDMTTARRFPKRHGKLAVDLMEFAREIVIHIQDANGSRNPDNGEARRGGDRRGVFLGVRLVASNSYNVRNVNSSGAMNWNNAYNGNRGVRPLWWNTANE